MKKTPAITLDTCIFESFGFNVDNMLKRMEPFIKRDFILSEIVVMELKAHYEVAYGATSRSFANFQKTFTRFSQDQNVMEQIHNLSDSLRNVKTDGHDSLENFIARTNAKVIPFGNITLEYVVNAYFNTAAPFRTGKKKSEFPDAIALYSLDKWAANNKRRIMAISADNDWAAFAEKHSERWMCVKRIEDAAKGIK